MALDRETTLRWLREEDQTSLDSLWSEADAVRRENVGDDVHLRAIIEISNHCIQHCGYCGINAGNRSVGRYRMSFAEVIDCVDHAARLGYGTVVLQSGEDPGLKAGRVADLVRAIKDRTGMAVTLSLGERCAEDFALWREAGADRYLMKFEAGRPELYAAIHPPLPDGAWPDRFAALACLDELGYEVGSGVMIGFPGQTYDDLADDILRFRELDLDMIGAGPYVPHPDTDLGRDRGRIEGQTPNTELMGYKVIALTRLACPEANIPSTTALETVADRGRQHGLRRGANVVMPPVTPAKYRRLYDIYPSRAGVTHSPEAVLEMVRGQIFELGRTVGAGQGPSPRHLAKLRQRGRSAPEREGGD